MARDDPKKPVKKPRKDIRNDKRPIPQEHHSARGDAPRNSGNFTRGSQLLNTQVLMWLQGIKMPVYMWLGVFVIAYTATTCACLTTACAIPISIRALRTRDYPRLVQGRKGLISSLVIASCITVPLSIWYVDFSIRCGKTTVHEWRERGVLQGLRSYYGAAVCQPI